MWYSSTRTLLCFCFLTNIWRLGVVNVDLILLHRVRLLLRLLNIRLNKVGYFGNEMCKVKCGIVWYSMIQSDTGLYGRRGSGDKLDVLLLTFWYHVSVTLLRWY